MSDSAIPDFAALVRPGDTVAWGQGAAEPLPLTRALVAERHRVGGRFRVFVGIGQSDALHADAADCIDLLSYCGTGTNRGLGEALDILPCHYSQFPDLIRSGALRVDVLLLQMSPADAQGRHSLGIAQDYLLAALDTARVVVAEINERMPWTHGERTLTARDFHAAIRSSRELPEQPPVAAGPAERAIAGHVAGLIEDGTTLQIGLGGIPEAVLSELHDRRDLGIHSGTIGDGVAELMAAGIVTNARKPIDTGVTVAGVMLGTRRIFDFAHANPRIRLRGTDYTHAAAVLERIDRFVAVNSAIEVDLSGQIASEVAGGRYVGAVGGANDFLRGAARSRGGLPIVALPSMAGSTSRIVAAVTGPVTVARSDAGLIVTEFGIADLRGLTLRQRARRMIDIAHPDAREALERAAFRRET